MKKLVVIDGYSFLFRAYHSMPALTRPKDNVPVGAIYGFMSMMMKIIFDMKPTHVVIVFDYGEKTFRHDIYSQYKANRPRPPEDLIPQFALVREAAKALNIAVLERKGYEADDIIATIANMSKANREDVLVVSSDKDLMQLINDHVQMYDAIKNKIIGIEEVKEKYGIGPEKVRDLLALVGDTSDNVPGVPGIGPKTAAELLNTFNNLDGLFANLEQIKQPKRRESLENSVELVKLSKSLVSLCDDLDLGVSFNDLESRPIDAKRLIDFLKEQGFKTLILRANKFYNIEDDDIPILEHNTDLSFSSIKVIVKSEELKKIVNIAISCKNISIHVQSNFSKNDKAKNVEDIHSLSLCFGNKVVYMILIAASPDQSSLLEPLAQGVSWYDFVQIFKSVFEDQSVIKVVWNYKNFLRLLEQSKVEVLSRSFDDIMMMTYNLGSGRDNTDFYRIFDFLFGTQDDVVESSIVKTRINFNALSESSKTYYVAKYAFLIDLAYKKLIKLLYESHAQTFYRNVDLPLIRVVFDVEKEGFKINKKILLDLDKDLEKEIGVLSKEIYEIAGTEFNISSSQQLSEILFNKLGFETKHKQSKSGSFSTSIEILEQLQQEGHKIADLLIQWRKLTKIQSTYTKSLVEHAKYGLSGDRVHTNFSIAHTLTGRFSSTDPNLQNIPVKGDWADKIRSAFVAKDGYKILTLDYSQIELRIIAAIADVASLKNAFKHDLDIHKVTASEMFGVALDDVDDEMRGRAKAINFGIIYGISGYGLAKNVGISQSEAKKYIERYFEKYPEIAAYMEKSKEFARAHGYIETITGRRCYIPNINSKDYAIRSFAERAAINFPIQGSSSDIMRKAMVRVADAIKDETLDCKMILQVHDELLFEVENSKAEIAKKLIKNIMEQVEDLPVPLPVNCSLGNTWAGI
jgi:DNA polymerase I